jgi:transposase
MVATTAVYLRTVSQLRQTEERLKPWEVNLSYPLASPIPARCPELNPVENVWQFMRDNWLSNRIYSSYDDIVDHCCFAWNRLIDQPWRIMSIGLRQWAHRF